MTIKLIAIKASVTPSTSHQIDLCRLDQFLAAKTLQTSSTNAKGRKATAPIALTFAIRWETIVCLGLRGPACFSKPAKLEPKPSVQTPKPKHDQQ